MKQLFPTMLCCSCLIFSWQNMAQESAGKTIMARGQVQASADEKTRSLQRRSPIFGADTVSTGVDSATQLRMIDGGLLSVQQQSELVIAQYDVDSNKASASISMSLLKGGLRTITGALQSDSVTYELSTPVASIGVRGTHFEAEILDNDLFLAGWQGIIDIQVSVPGKAKTFSLGPTEAYRFAVVRVNGDVEFMLNVPPAFTEGYSNTLLDDMSQPSSDVLAMNTTEDNIWSAVDEPNNDYSGKEWFDNDRLLASWIPDSLDGLTRTGSVTFDNLADSHFTSSNGQLTDFSMSMQIDFDSARVSSGNLSFSDSGGEWFAVFNGFIGEQALDLNVNFASHGNNLADGSLSGLLLNDGAAVLGELELHELDDTNVNVNGTYLLTEKQP